MISREDMLGLFADMKQNAPWDISKPLTWGYFWFFTDYRVATRKRESGEKS